MNIPITIITSIILYYIIQKEREVAGCGNFTIEKHCDDSKSVYLIDTKMQPNDSYEKLLERLKSALSYHEKATVWRKCILISFACVVIVHIVYKMNERFDDTYNYLVLLLCFSGVLYFYHNYLNYHYFRALKNNGEEIIDFITKKN
jgi:hypothetical protein